MPPKRAHSIWCADLHLSCLVWKTNRDRSDQIPSYPSHALHFLTSAGLSTHANDTNNHPGSLPLNISVVGAGLAGLATAIALARNHHYVTVFEQAGQLAEVTLTPWPFYLLRSSESRLTNSAQVGAGIQIPPNSSRLLSRLGLNPYLKGYVTEPESVLMRRWQNGKVIGRTQLIPDSRNEYGAPYYVIHRAHFHEAMHKLAVDLGVTVKLSSRVVSYAVDDGSIILENGQTVTGDLIVAAAVRSTPRNCCSLRARKLLISVLGVKSTARQEVLGGHDRPPQPTGFAVYRAVVDIDRMKADPDVSWILEKPSFNLWYVTWQFGCERDRALY